MPRGRFDQSSPSVQWLVIRNNSSFLQKRKLVTLTSEPNNLKNRNSFRLNGLVHPKVVGVETAADGKGVVLTTGNTKNINKPAKRLAKVKLTKDSRRALTTIRRTIRSKSYRKDLKMAALRRASALLRGQRSSLTAGTATSTATTAKTAGAKRAGKSATTTSA